MYRVFVSGTYVLTGKLSQIDSYEVSFEMVTGDVAEARAIIQNSGMLDEKLRKEVEFYKRWQTCQVVDVQPLEEFKKDEAAAVLEVLVLEATGLACLPANYKQLKSNKLKKSTLKDAIVKKKERIAARNKKEDGTLID